MKPTNEQIRSAILGAIHENGNIGIQRLFNLVSARYPGVEYKSIEYNLSELVRIPKIEEKLKDSN